MPPIRLHDLRHGAATLAHAASADIKAIQALLRHARYSITADTYTTVLQETHSALAASKTLGPTTAPQPHPDPRESAAWP